MPCPYKQIGCRAAVLAVVLLSGIGSSHAATLAEYRGLIIDCRHAVEQHKMSDTQIQDLCSRLSAIATVTYPGGDAVRVNTHPLTEALRRHTEGSTAALRFAALEGLLTSTGETAAKDDPRAQAEQVLADKEFADLRKPVKPIKSVVPSWWVRFTKWAKEMAERFSEWLSRLFRDRRSPHAPNLAGVQAFVKFLQFLLYFLLGVAALVALYLLARTAAARGWLEALRKRRRRGGDADLDLDLSGDGIADPLGAARALAAQGAYREAVRMAYIASLRRLQENGSLVLESNKTNWEYQRELQRRSRAAFDTLLPATRLFDRVWYGRRTGTAEEFAEAVRVHDALEGLPDDSADDVEEKAALIRGVSPS